MINISIELRSLELLELNTSEEVNVCIHERTYTKYCFHAEKTNNHGFPGQIKKTPCRAGSTIKLAKIYIHTPLFLFIHGLAKYLLGEEKFY